MPSCTLCDLPTPEPPITDPAVSGQYCCRGCLEVARTLDGDVDGADPTLVRAAYRESTNGDTATVDTGDGDGSGEVPDGETAYFDVDGMHCATCEVFLEERARDLPGVSGVDASYAGDALKVTYDPDEAAAEDLPAAISGYGYHVSAKTDAPTVEDDSLSTGVRLLLGGFFGMMVMLWYVLFLYPTYLGHGSLLPFFDVGGVAGRYLLWNVAVLSGAGTAIAGYPMFRGALISLRAGRPNMDLLVGLAAGVAYVYSLAVLALGGSEVYFDVPIVIVLAVTLGNYWESRVKRRATEGLAAYSNDRDRAVRVRTEHGIQERSQDAIDPGDAVVVSTGEHVPFDGTVVDGEGAVDESVLTGTAAPRAVGVGDEVVGGSTLVAGGVTFEVADGAERTLDRVLEALWDVQSTHRGVQRLADRIASVFVPAVLALAALALVGSLLFGSAPDVAILTGLSVLVVSCPCALGLATPLAVSSGVRAALERGVVVTDAGVFERASDVDVVAFDKTGTLTTGSMTVVDVAGDTAALDLAAALEAYADHPVAQAVYEYGDPPDAPVSALQRHALGVSGTVGGESVLVGRPDLFRDEGWDLPTALADRATTGDRDGFVPVVVGTAGRARAVALAGDQPRPGWESAVEELASVASVVVLTGDEAGADRFRDHDAVEEVFAGVPPEAKRAVVDRLGTRGTVAMVGDGTNDAPALAAADLGVAMASGTAIASDAADVVITTDDLDTLPAVLDIAGRTRRRVRENLAWAFGYNAVAIPLALLGLLNPLLAAVAMAASSLLVVTNSVRSVDSSPTVEGDRFPLEESLPSPGRRGGP